MATKKSLAALNEALDNLRSCRVRLTDVSDLDESALDTLFTLDGYVYGLGDSAARGQALSCELREKLGQISFQEGRLVVDSSTVIEIGSNSSLVKLAEAIACVTARIVEVI
jgi:hypothetical protein